MNTSYPTRKTEKEKPSLQYHSLREGFLVIQCKYFPPFLLIQKNSAHPWAMAFEAFLNTSSHFPLKNPGQLRVFHLEEETMEVNGHDLMPSGPCPSS